MQWWKWVLVIGTILYPFISVALDSDRKKRKLDVLKGCICKPSFWGMVEHNCPVHNPFYIRHYVTLDGKASLDKIYASYGHQEPICVECLTKILPRGYIVTWPLEEGESWCHTCSRMKQVQMIPERDLLLWGKTSHKEEPNERSE